MIPSLVTLLSVRWTDIEKNEKVNDGNVSSVINLFSRAFLGMDISKGHKENEFHKK